MVGSTFVKASVAVAFLSASSVAANPIFSKRNDYNPVPPCSQPFTPFDYVGCFVDTSTPYRSLRFDTKLSWDNMTVELCTSSCKANNYRYAGLEYYGQCFCGSSVNGPLADDQGECSFACNGDKSETCGGNDRISVYQDPSFKPFDKTVISDYQSMGCYSEGVGGRAVNFRQDSLDSDDMTTELCLSTCKEQGYSFAATEYAGECYCGVVLGNGTAPADASKCNMACNGDDSEICGGSGYLNLYVAADLQDTAPCDLPPPGTTAPVTSTTASSTTAYVTSTTTTTTTSAVPTTTTTTTSSAVPTTTTYVISTTTTTTTTSAAPTTTTTTTAAVSTTTSSAAPTTTTTTTTSAAPTTTTTTTTTTTKASTTTTTTTAVPTTTTTTTTKATTITTTAPVTTTAPPVTTTKATTTTLVTSKCSSIAPAPTCEYGCNNKKWCSTPLPHFGDQNGCLKAAASCALQVFDCYASGGDFLSCSNFLKWCSSVGTYCHSSRSIFSKSDCLSKLPPANAPTSTPGVCTPAATTTVAPSATTSKVIPPTATNVCVLPTGKPNSGYSGGNCVGGIQPPFVTCNDVYSDWQQKPFKLFSSKYSSQCPSYGKGQVSSACQQACKIQYTSCVNNYAEDCKSNYNNGVSYFTASSQCKSQYYDCLDANDNVYTGNRCSSWNGGWS